MRSATLTATRLATFRGCPRRHYYRFELGLSRIRGAAPLRFGKALHLGLEAHNGGATADEAVARAAAGYEQPPEWADPTDWTVERETLAALLAGHFWRYDDDDVQIIAAEQVFDLPLVNPRTGRQSRTFRLGGKIDAIVRLPDGRLAVLEYKTAGEDIGPDSEYWLRLRCDPQLSHYVLAARTIGHDVATVLYDATRKPTIRLRRNETPEQYGERLLADLGERPDYYFQRREVPRLEDELAEYRLELWQQARQLREAQRHGRWFRNVGRMTCSHCAFSAVCLNGIHVEPGGPPPTGYEYLDDVHPELASGDDS